MNQVVLDLSNYYDYIYKSIFKGEN